MTLHAYLLLLLLLLFWFAQLSIIGSPIFQPAISIRLENNRIDYTRDDALLRIKDQP